MGLFTKGASEYRKGLKAEEARDYKSAFSYFTEAAQKDHPHACYRLSVCYAKGLGTSQDYEKALYWAKNAELFDIDGEIEEDIIGYISELEETISKQKKAKDVTAKKAAAEAKVLEEQEKQEAMIRQSEEEFPDDTYSSNELVNKAFELFRAKEYEKALGIFLRFADAGIAQAQYTCGLMYSVGEGTEASKERALLWMGKAAEQDYPAAQYEYAMMHNDLKSRLKWLSKAYKQTEDAEVREKAEDQLKKSGVTLDMI